MSECPVLDEYTKWYREVCDPKVSEWAEHIRGCPACQAAIDRTKDKMAFDLLSKTTQQIIDEARPWPF